MAVVVLSSQCKVSATGVEEIIHSECVVDSSVCVDLLDVWTGVSSFADGFSRHQHVAVEEHAWIEWSIVAGSLLSAIYGKVKH